MRRSAEDEALDPATPAERLWELALGRSADEGRFEVVLEGNGLFVMSTLNALMAELSLTMDEARGHGEKTPSPLVEGATAAQALGLVKALARAGAEVSVQARASSALLPAARAIAGNTGAPPALLERLSLEGDEATRKALVKNPSCPVAILLWLGRARADALLENPLLPLLLLEDQHLKALTPIFDALFAATRAFPRLLPTALGSAEGRWHLAGAKVRGLPEPVLRSLARDTSVDVRLRLAANRGAPAIALGWLCDDGEWLVRAAVAANPGAPALLLRRLARDPSPMVLEAVAKNPGSPPDARARARASLS